MSYFGRSPLHTPMNSGPILISSYTYRACVGGDQDRAFAYTYELRPYLDLLLHMLCMEDSWQNHRIQKALKGIPDDHSSRDGLFETIQRSKNHYQKRAYQCIKMLVALFSQCAAARNMLEGAGDLKRKWTWAVEWLHDELERGGGHRAPYANTASSNETANGYFLERSHSA